MKVNCKKRSATGKLYNCVKSGLLDNIMGPKGMKMLRKQLAQLTGR